MSQVAIALWQVLEATTTLPCTFRTGASPYDINDLNDKRYQARSVDETVCMGATVRQGDQRARGSAALRAGVERPSVKTGSTLV